MDSNTSLVPAASRIGHPYPGASGSDDAQDEDMYTAIARRHGPALYRLALRLTADESDAHDLVQDTFERCLCKLPEGLDSGRIHCWLCTTLRHRHLDLRRSPEHRDRVPIPDTEFSQIPAQEREEEPSWTQVDPHSFWECVNRLEPGLREVFLLRTREGLTRAVIAQHLCIAICTVSQRYSRALDQLRQALVTVSPAVSDPSGSSFTCEEAA